jgi:hypothetical protein
MDALATIKGYALVEEPFGDWVYAIYRLRDRRLVFRAERAHGEYGAQDLLQRLDHFVNGVGSRPPLTVPA